jgi:hypothetical protein
MSKYLFRFLFQKTLLCPMLHGFWTLYISFFSPCFFVVFRPFAVNNKNRNFEVSAPHPSYSQIKSKFNTKISKIMNELPKNYTQDPVIIQFRYSGYYQDRAEFSQLLKRHRIKYQDAIDAYRFGAKVRQNRLKCGFPL